MKYLRLPHAPAAALALLLTGVLVFAPLAFALADTNYSSTSTTDTSTTSTSGTGGNSSGGHSGNWTWSNTHYVAKLSGANEVPPVTTGGTATTTIVGSYGGTTTGTTTTGNFGDTTGNFFARASSDGNALHFILDVKNGKNITMAHLHCAPAGQTGPVVLPLFGEIQGGVDVSGELASLTLTDRNVLPASATNSSTSSTGTTTGTTTSTTTTSTGSGCPVAITDIESLVQAMEDGYIYVNVHSTDYPNGVARGQVSDVVGKAESSSFLDSFERLVLMQFQLRDNLAELRDGLLNQLGLMVQA